MGGVGIVIRISWDNGDNGDNAIRDQVVTSEKALSLKKVGTMKKKQVQCGTMQGQCKYRTIINTKVLNIRYIS
jgi:hypothetical protein